MIHLQVGDWVEYMLLGESATKIGQIFEINGNLVWITPTGLDEKDVCIVRGEITRVIEQEAL